MNKENYPDKIYATKKIGTNGIHCLDYRNEEEDVEYAKVGNVAKPNACSQLCDVTALKEYIRSCIDNFSRHNKDHPEDTTNSAFQFAFEGIMRKIDELCKD